MFAPLSAFIFSILLIISQNVFSQTSNSLYNSLPDNEPQLIAPGRLSTTMGEYSPTYDIHSQELMFMRRTPGEFDYRIYTSIFSDGKWSSPVFASFSGQHRDAAPHFSPDGSTLVFDSSRPDERVAESSINLYMTKRTSANWTEPVLLEALSVNDGNEPVPGRDEFGPALDGKGNLYFYSFRQPYRGGRLYKATEEADFRDLQPDDNLPDPSASTFVGYPYLTPDGHTLIIEGRNTGGRDTDLFYACKEQDGKWTAAKELEMVNTDFGEGVPYMSADGLLLFFASSRPDTESATANANLYMVRTDSLPVPCPAQYSEG